MTKDNDKKNSKEQLKEIFNFKGIKFANFIFLTIAGLINAVGTTMFLVPAKLYDVGFAGTSFLLSQVTSLNLSIWIVILNIPFFLFALKKAGVKYLLYSLWAIGIYALFTYLFQNQFSIDYSGGSPLVGDEILLCCLCGGLLSGISSGLTIRNGGALDGVEVVAVFTAKRMGLSVGSFVMIYNAIIYAIAGIVFHNFIIALYSVLAYVVALKAVDFVVDGFDKGKAVIVITEKSDEVARGLSNEFGRGLTVIKAQGFYSKECKKLIYCVVNRFELSKLKAVIEGIDTKAFIAVNEVTDTSGSDLKFSPFKRKKRKTVFSEEQELNDDIVELNDIKCEGVENQQIEKIMGEKKEDLKYKE